MTNNKTLAKFKNKKVFITGNTGFKGSWLSIWLHELGADVYGYALRPKSDLDNFIVCELDKKINQTYGDIRNAKLLQEKIAEVNPDYIFHLAAQALVIDSYNDPISTYSTNVMGAVNVLQAARRADALKSLIIITSDKCYENKEQVWGYRENDQLGGSDPYSSSKACVEIAVQSFRRSFYQDSSVSVVTTRAGNVIGGGDWSENRLLPDFFKSLRSGVEFEIRNPNATRPWEHVLEPLSGYMQLAILSDQSKDFEGAWNFGSSSHRHYNVLEVIQEIEKSVACSYTINTPKNHFHEANLLKLDITKAVNHLKWHPQLDFEDTIKYTVEGYRVQGQKDIYTHRVKQINDYTELAIKNKTAWAI